VRSGLSEWTTLTFFKWLLKLIHSYPVISHFVLVSLSCCFTVPYPCKARKITPHQRNSKKGCLCKISLYPTLSLPLTSLSFLDFVFYIIDALRYLPRARIFAHRRPPATLLYCFGWRCTRCTQGHVTAPKENKPRKDHIQMYVFVDSPGLLQDYQQMYMFLNSMFET